MLTAFVVLQLAFDLTVLVLLVLGAARRRVGASAAPPEWYPQFVALAEEVLAATEPVLDALEARAPAAVPGPAPADRHREAAALLRAGADPEDLARRGGLLPGELALIRNLVGAEGHRARGAR